jgi:hypothetical protein
MIDFKEWRKKEATVEVGQYKIILQDIGNGRILLSASSSEQMIDSKKEVKQVIDLTELNKPTMTGLALSAPLIEPYNSRNNN